MKAYGDLHGRSLRAHRRLLRRVQYCGPVYVDSEPEFRMAERLHRAGLITAAVDRFNLLGRSRRTFKRLALFASETEARERYGIIMPRGRS